MLPAGLFGECLSAVSLRDIADAVGHENREPLLHFDSKESLVE